MSKPAIEILCLRAVRAQRAASSLRHAYQTRSITSTTAPQATALPITAAGPPPAPPSPSPSQYGSRVDQMRKKAAMIEQGKNIRAQQAGGKSSPLRKRFWKDVHIKEVDAGYQIYLDTRPVRTPTKTILTIPKSKPQLAHAIAIEWDLLTSAQQALKGHNIPMTSIVSRAQNIIEAESTGDGRIRDEILRTMMRYLETDTLLCWADSVSGVGKETSLDMHKETERQGRGLREIQKETSEQIISYLNTTVWPGVEIKPVLEENSIMPTKQTDVTISIITGWISGLSAFDLAGLERAVLASKSLLVGTRLLIEWSEDFRDVQRSAATRFGIEEAALVSSIEVRWQTGVWGEVEDSHDVEKEDARRQLGSAVLVISGAR